MTEKHLIYRQVLEIEFPSREEALDGQEFLSRLYRQELVPLINKIFDGCLDSDQYLSLELLEIDLGEIPSQNFGEEVKRKLHQKLQDELLLKMQNSYFHQHQNGHKSVNNGDLNHSIKTELNSRNNRVLEEFRFFMENGLLPWWSSRERKFTPAKMAEKLLKDQPEEFNSLVLKLLKSETSRQRLIFQLPDVLLLKIHNYRSAGSVIPKSILSHFKDLYLVHKMDPILPVGIANFRLFLWRSLFSYRPSSTNNQSPQSAEKSKLTYKSTGTPPRPGLSSQTFLIYLIHQFKKNRIYSSDFKNSKNPKQSPFHYMISQIQKGVRKSGLQNRPLAKALNSITNLQSSEIETYRFTPNDSELQANSGIESSATRSAEAVATTKRSKIDHNNESIEIANAGLVITTPFLPLFFDALGLLSDKVFTSNESSEHAALILQYIATGETEMPEYELPLNKILCGLSIDTPLPHSLQISDHEEEEVQNLLSSVIEHWKALKGTSANGLRQAFLNRPGLLTEETNGWNLYVERITADVLLDHLPWSISIIKLPWNDKLIHVEW